MSNELLISISVFIATILGGACVYEYSAWRTEKKIQKYTEKYGLNEIKDLLKELKEVLT